VITIQNGAGTTVMSRPGFEVTILNWNTPPGQPVRVTEAEIEHWLAVLTSKPGQNGGVPGLRNVVIGECGIIGFNCPNLPSIPTGTGESDAFQIIIQSTHFGTGRGHSPNGGGGGGSGPSGGTAP
jgi:hypothetical protein